MNAQRNCHLPLDGGRVARPWRLVGLVGTSGSVSAAYYSNYARALLVDIARLPTIDYAAERRVCSSSVGAF